MVQGQGLEVRGQGLVNWSLRILKDKDFCQGQQHWWLTELRIYRQDVFHNVHCRTNKVKTPEAKLEQQNTATQLFKVKLHLCYTYNLLASTAS